MFRNNLSLFVSQSYTVAIAAMLLFYFSIENAYKHGRYRRV